MDDEVKALEEAIERDKQLVRVTMSNKETGFYERTRKQYEEQLAYITKRLNQLIDSHENADDHIAAATARIETNRAKLKIARHAAAIRKLLKLQEAINELDPQED